MKKFLSLVLALVMTMSLVTISAGAKDFTDADEIDYPEAIDVLSAVKVIDGYTDGSFKPATQLNRGQAAKIICNLILGPTTASALKASTAPFSDVPADSTFAGYITYCAKEGIVGGYGDGTFKAGAPLTGYAFMKMLLAALGYDADIEGYNNPNNWWISVAKQAIGIGLDDGLKNEFDGNKIVTREEACLYALNALKADMVEYDSKTQITIGGADVVIAGSVAKKVENKATTETLYNDDVMQLAEKYFPKLGVEVVDGVYGRPSNKWLNAKSEIGTYASIEPSFVYTEATEEQDIYKDMGKSIVDYKDWEYFVDGKAVAGSKPGKSVDDDYAFTNDGAVCEIYVNDDDETVTVVEYNYYLGEVTKVKDGTITVAPMSDTKLNDKTFETEDFEEEDLVVFTRDIDDDGDYVICEIVAPETVTGTVSRVEKDTNDSTTYLRVDGTKIPYSAHNYYDVTNSTLTRAHPTLNDEYIIYMDPNGFVVGFEPAEKSVDQYLYVLDTHESLRNEARVLLADGTEVDIKIDEVNGSSVAPGTLNTIKNRICTYDVDKKGVYDLDVVAYRTGTGDGSVIETWGTKASEINNGRAYFTAATGTTVIVDKKTTFVDYDGEAVYTGYADVPSFDEATLAYVVEDKVAVVVFVLEGEKYDSDSTYFVLKNTTHESLKYDSNNYREYLNAYVNGEKTSLNVRYDALDGHTGDEAGANTALKYGVVYKVLKTVDEDYIIDVEQVADKTSAKTVETVGADAFWLTPAGGETYKANQWDVDNDTVFMVVDYKEDGKVDSIYEGKLKNMDDDDYTITVSVLKKDDQTAELVVIFRDPVAEPVEPTPVVPEDGVDVEIVGDQITVTVFDTATAYERAQAIEAALAAKGCTNIDITFVGGAITGVSAKDGSIAVTYDVSFEEVSYFDMQDFAAYPSFAANGINVGWGYTADLDLDEVVGAEVGLKDADGKLIVRYTATAEQFAWAVNEYNITTNHSAPFAPSVPAGTDSDWTVEKGPAFDEWNPVTCYVTISTAFGSYTQTNTRTDG